MDKYTWVDIGSSYLPSELNAAYLMGQLDIADQILKDRMDAWNAYYSCLSTLLTDGQVELPFIPSGCEHNAHMFWIKTANTDERAELIGYLKKSGISSVFHYIPLHSSPAGCRFGRFYGNDRYTTKESERLLRLPMYWGLTADDSIRISEAVAMFYKHH